MCCRALIRQLKQEYDVSYVNNGEKAYVAMCANNQAYDLLITDIDMPIMDGLTLIDKLRSTNNNVPIILCSGSEENEDRIGSRAILQYFKKPYDIECVKECIHKHFSDNNKV